MLLAYLPSLQICPTQPNHRLIRTVDIKSSLQRPYGFYAGEFNPYVRPAIMPN